MTRGPATPPRATGVDVSVMLCTWNNSRRLRETLRGLGACAVPRGLRWQLVVVNNNCSDDTDAVVHSFGGQLPVVSVHEPRLGLNRARNAGLQSATGRLLVLTDDDVTVSEGWLAEYWAAFVGHPGNYFFGGPITSAFEGGRPDDELLRLAPRSVSGFDLGDRAGERPTGERFLGANWACPVDAVRAVGGFNPQVGLNASPRHRIGGSETELMDRLVATGLGPWYLPAARVVHHVPVEKCTLKHVGRRAESYAFRVAWTAPTTPPARVPRWMHRRATEHWLRWLWERARGRKGYEAYVEWRRALGTIRGLREARRAPPPDRRALREGP